MTVKYFFLALLCLLTLCSLGCNSKKMHAEYLQDLGDGICRNAVSGLMWQCGKSEAIKTVEGARLYAKKLSLGGYADWRLPTRHELYDLAYIFDLHLNGKCVLDCEGTYWFESKDGKAGVGGWEISATQCDPARQYFSGSQGHVRAVRP